MKQFWPLEFIDGVENPYWETKRELFENTAHRYTLSGTMSEWQERIPQALIIPVSAKERFNIDSVLNAVISKLPVSPL